MMRFNIFRKAVTYGGPPPNEWDLIAKDVSADYVEGYFVNVDIDGNFATKPDTMGCYVQYKIVVSRLERSQ